MEHDLIPPTRKMYSGPAEVGEDLRVIVGGEKVGVRRPVRSSLDAYRPPRGTPTDRARVEEIFI
jgi:hypothetical protein